MSNNTNWRQLANIRNGTEGKALKEYLEGLMESAMDDLTRDTSGLDGLTKLLEVRGRLTVLKNIISDLEKAQDIAKHNEGSAKASSQKDSG